MYVRIHFIHIPVFPLECPQNIKLGKATYAPRKAANT
jgi:hypothetical protein